MKKPIVINEKTRREMAEITLRVQGLKSRLRRLGMHVYPLPALRAALVIAKRNAKKGGA